MSSPADSVNPHTKIGAYVFSPNWKEARALVESDEWYQSDEAVNQMTQFTLDVREALAAESIAIFKELFDVAAKCLDEIRTRGAEDVFGELEILDERFEELSHISETEKLYWELSADKTLFTTFSLSMLRMLILRASVLGDEERSKRLNTLAEILVRVKEEGLGWLGAEVAEWITSDLRNLSPQNAPPEAVGFAERAIALLEHEEGSELWLELHILLGALLLESPLGERADNVARAERTYRAVLDCTAEGTEMWARALGGLANTLSSQPTAVVRQNEAFRLYKRLAEHHRSRGEVMELAGVLGNNAWLLSSMSHGDVDAKLEQAISLQREATDLYEPLDSDGARIARGRALHNLGTHYAKRRSGVRSQNVDLAVNAFNAALEIRTPNVDPVGRAKTLRALSVVFPEWTGADSLAHAKELAQAAIKEAETIADLSQTEKARAEGWAAFARQRSALHIDLDSNYQMPPDDHFAWLKETVSNHEQAVGEIPRDTQPILWAEWMGGLGRVLGRLPSLGVWNRLDKARACFDQAIAALGELDQPRLLRDLHGRYGELSHEIGDWKRSFENYSAAVELSHALFEDFALRESRLKELQEAQGFAQFAAYAAFRLDRLEDGVRMVELARGRSLADLISAAQALRRVPADARSAIREITGRIARLETEETSEAAGGLGAKLADIQGGLADYVGVRPEILGINLTAQGKVFAEQQQDQVATERERIRDSLMQARAQLREYLDRARASDGLPADWLDSAEIGAIAARAQRPLVYLMTTVHGGAALVVAPDRSLDAIPLPDITSDETNRMVYGADEEPGFARGASYHDESVLHASLAQCLPILRQKVMDPLSQWLSINGHAGAILIPVGSMSLLPLHAAGGPRDVYGYAPSARALSLALDKTNKEQPKPSTLSVIANPKRENETPLPFAVAEARALARSSRTREMPVSIVARGEANVRAVRDVTSAASLVHFACHGRFRPSAPLETHLMLAGEDRITVADIFARTVDLSNARLVTLSACQTANIEYYKNPDESIGFPAALVLAGVPSVVATLWSVDDAAAALFLSRMYERILLHDDDCATALEEARGWLRTATNESLAQAARHLREALEDSDDDADAALSRLWHRFVAGDKNAVPYAEPIYWAGFALFGTW